MKEGDMIEWRGVDKMQRGRLERDTDGALVCRLQGGKVLPLDCLLGSPSLKKI